MKNDFYKSDFWTKKHGEDDTQKYLLKINKKWIEVTNDVYAIYKNSYQKMYRDNIRDLNRIKYIDDIGLLSNDFTENNAIDRLYKQELYKNLHKAIEKLPSNEQLIIKGIYFNDYSERELALQLNIPNTTLHNRKIKILKKLRNILEQDDF